MTDVLGGQQAQIVGISPEYNTTHSSGMRGEREPYQGREGSQACHPELKACVIVRLWTWEARGVAFLTVTIAREGPYGRQPVLEADFFTFFPAAREIANRHLDDSMTMGQDFGGDFVV